MSATVVTCRACGMGTIDLASKNHTCPTCGCVWSPSPHGQDVEALVERIRDEEIGGGEDFDCDVASHNAAVRNFARKLLAALRSRPVEPEPVAWALMVKLDTPREVWDAEEVVWSRSEADAWLVDAPDRFNYKAKPLYASPVAPAWQSIETAPKSDALPWRGKQVPILVATDKGRVFETVRSSFGVANLYGETATHWMPLPVAPREP